MKGKQVITTCQQSCHSKSCLTENVAMSSTALGTKNLFADEGQQQFSSPLVRLETFCYWRGQVEIDLTALRSEDGGITILQHFNIQLSHYTVS
jgi:hypothetical protein